MKNRIILAMLLAGVSVPAISADFGTSADQLLEIPVLAAFRHCQATGRICIRKALEKGYRTPASTEGDAVALAEGLTAKFLTREAADKWDMMTFYPADKPTHMIACIEGDREEIAPGKFNPAVQSVSLADGKVETIVRGTRAAMAFAPPPGAQSCSPKKMTSAAPTK